MRLRRPYIPLRIRVQVAERQLAERGGNITHVDWGAESDTEKLDLLLAVLFPGQKVELHHRPALCNRRIVPAPGAKPGGKFYFFDAAGKIVRYEPNANDPDYLVYLPVDEHDIETRVRGLRGQHSDLGLRRKWKRKERKLKHPRRLLRSRGFAKRPRQRSASRPIAR